MQQLRHPDGVHDDRALLTAIEECPNADPE
jgi:hypothetical protein